MPPIVKLPGGAWCLAVELDNAQRQRLVDALAQAGAPRLFWPGLLRLVEALCTEAVQRDRLARDMRSVRAMVPASAVQE